VRVAVWNISEDRAICNIGSYPFKFAWNSVVSAFVKLRNG
jgi:hypothetical protein